MSAAPTCCSSCRSGVRNSSTTSVNLSRAWAFCSWTGSVRLETRCCWHSVKVLHRQKPASRERPRRCKLRVRKREPQPQRKRHSRPRSHCSPLSPSRLPKKRAHRRHCNPVAANRYPETFSPAKTCWSCWSSSTASPAVSVSSSWRISLFTGGNVAAPAMPGKTSSSSMYNSSGHDISRHR